MSSHGSLSEVRELFDNLFTVDDSLSVLGRWEISFAEMARACANGLPKVTFTLPFDGAYQYQSPWEAFYLLNLQYGRTLRAAISPIANRAGWEVTLFKPNGAGK